MHLDMTMEFNFLSLDHSGCYIFFLIVQSMRQDDSYSAVFSAQLGYVIYRRVLRYYSGEEDGLGQYSIS